jgi:hypothetical protein
MKLMSGLTIMARIALGCAGALLLATLPANAVTINFQPGLNQLVSFDKPSGQFTPNSNIKVFENFDNVGKAYAAAPSGSAGVALKAPTTTLAAAGANGTLNSNVYTSNISGQAARPFAQTATNAGTPLSAGNYASVRLGGRFVINFSDYFIKPVQVFSFALGSVDGRNAQGQAPNPQGTNGPFKTSGNKVTLYLVDGTTAVFTGSELTNGAADGNQSSGSTNGRVTFDTRGMGGGILGAKFESTVNAFEFDDFAGAVPEPATWGMMILGFGLAGFGLRRGRRPVAA